jgi:alpha-D-ribose 1-methylphosphonate 5-triphosphate synthase subunit PhnG
MDFLDKMKDGITKGIDTVSAKGKDLMEDAQAHLAIRNLQNEREKAVAELGALALALFQKGALADEGAKKVCENIASIDRQIAAKEAELKADKA